MRIDNGVNDLNEIRCKNDDCRKLLGYEKIKVGIVAFECRHCETISVFRIKYPRGQEFFDKIVDLAEDKEVIK